MRSAHLSMNAATHHLRRVFALALAMAAVLAIPATANAAFARADSGKLTFIAVPGEANDLTVTSSGNSLRLAEAGRLGPFPVLIAGSGGCSGLAAAIDCTGATSVSLNTSDGNDRISARDGVVERIACGSGTDRVTADATDVTTDCETVDRPSAPVAPTQPSGGDSLPGKPATPEPTTGDSGAAADLANPFVNIVAPAIPRQTVAVSPAGVASVQVACPATAGSCKGTVALFLVRSAGRARVVAAAGRSKAPKGIKLGSAKFTAQGGEKPVVHIRLNRRARRRIIRRRHTRCRIVVTTRSADGRVVTTTRSITLRAKHKQKHKRRKHR